jgi:carboxyl-terminal processing protease
MIRAARSCAVLAVAALTAGFPLAAADEPAPDLARALKQLISVYVTAEEQAADPVSPDALLYGGAIPGMLRTLDPHSVFFDPDQFEQLKQMQSGEQKGFGTIVSVLPGRVIILQTQPGSPAAKAGLAAGDEILAINGYLIARLEPEQLVALMTQARRQEATLDVRHPGEASVEQVTMSPELVTTPSVDRAFELSPRIGYVRVTAFETDTGKLVRQAIEKLGGEYLRGLVLDLRDNPGGDVQAAVQTAGLFLSPGQLIFKITGRGKTQEEARVDKLVTPYTFPVAILVNGKSASASEIVTGALQDHDRAFVFGEPTYGKGLVQQVYPLSANTGLALTTAFYYTPSGRSIQKPLNAGQLGKATSSNAGTFKTDSGRLVMGGGGIQPDEVVHPDTPTRLRLVLDASGVLTSFAAEYLKSHSLNGDFEVSGEMLDELRVFLSARSIQPGVGEWLADRDWISSRLKQELLTLKFGVAKGDEMEMRRDPVVKAALRKIAASN